MNIVKSRSSFDEVRPYNGFLGSDPERNQARLASYSYDENGDPIDAEKLRQFKADERLRVKTKILAGRSHHELSNLIATKIGIPLTRVKTTDFGNTEIGVEITESVRGFHVFIIQTGGPYDGRSINDHVMELYQIVDACILSSAKSVSVILPCYPYARSDKKDSPRVSIMGACVTRMLISLGVKRIIAMDLHAAQIQGFSSVPFDNLYAIKIHVDNLANTIFSGLSSKELNEQYVLVSPDVGGAKRVEAYAVRLGLGHVIMHKHRNYDKPGTVDGTTLVGMSGEITGKTAIIIDDIIDSMSTMVAAANELKKFGVEHVIILVTHGIFSGLAFDRINNTASISKVIVCNTLPQLSNLTKTSKLEIVDTSDVFVSVIRAIQGGTSISSLFLPQGHKST